MSEMKLFLSVVLNLIVLFGDQSVVVVNGLTTRDDRFWPIDYSGQGIDFVVSSCYGPRQKYSESNRYDFHRGLDLPCPMLTPLRAIDDGWIRINGSHPSYSDGVIQVVHENFAEGGKWYATYLHVNQSLVDLNQPVSKGDIIGLSGASVSGFEHLHLEIRSSYYQRDSKNPWRLLPLEGRGTSTSVHAEMVGPIPEAGSSGQNITIRAIIGFDDLVLNGFSVDMLDSNDIPIDLDTIGGTIAWEFLWEELNAATTQTSLMDEAFRFGILTVPDNFVSSTYINQENHTWEFTLVDRTIPETAATLRVTLFDVIDGTQVFDFPIPSSVETTPEPTPLPTPLPATTPPTKKGNGGGKPKSG